MTATQTPGGSERGPPELKGDSNNPLTDRYFAAEEIKRYERDIHDESWQEYVEVFVNSTLWRAVRKVYLGPLLRRLLRAGVDRALDVGCGPSPTHANAFGGYVGVDISRKSLEQARKGLPEKQFAVADAERLPFKAGSFDAILCFGSLHHLPDPSEFLRETSRCLREGGYYAGYEPNATWRRLDPLQRLAATRLGVAVSRALYPTDEHTEAGNPIHSVYEREFEREEMIAMFGAWDALELKDGWVLDFHAPSLLPQGLARAAQEWVFRIDLFAITVLRPSGKGHIHTVLCRRPSTRGPR